MRLLRVLHYTLKIVAYGLCALGCIYQVASILKIYFSYPSLVFSFIEIMDTLTLPAISLCNNNRSFDTSFDRKWIKLQDRLKQSKNVNHTKMVMQRLIDRAIRHLMDSLSVNEFAQLGQQWVDLVPPEYFKCATDPFNLNNKCIKYANLIESAQAEGNCFTMFGRSENEFLMNIAIKSGLSQSPVIRGTGDALNLEIAEQPFHPNEIFRMMVNFSVSEYTTTNDKIIGYVMVHDQNELPPIRDKNFIIYPGFYYEFYVNKETGKYLPSPYETDCIKYDMKGSTRQSFIPNVLSRETCIMNCMAEKTVQSCHCWPPELPYVLDQNNTEQRLKWCSWRDGANIQTDNKSDSSNWFRYCFSNHEDACTSQCKMQCQVDKYTAVRQSFVWPSNERMEHSTKFNKEYRECCAIVSLRFWSSEQTTLKYEPKYAFVEFISYFGGLLSIWLGFSLVKTYDVLEVIAKRTFKRCRSNGKIDLKIFKRKSKHSRAIRPRVAGYLKTRYNQTSI